MRLTIPYYHDFGGDRGLVGHDLGRPEAWDALRTRTSGDFALPPTRDAWERQADEHGVIRERARAVGTLLDNLRVGRLASYGVGGATLELWLKRLSPDRELLVTDYAPAAVERLASLFPEADVRRHDLLREPPLTAELHLFHRIDTEFTNRQWRSILRGFAGQRALLVASEVIDMRRAVAELRSLPAKQLRRATRAGRIRTAGALEALWSPTHTARRLSVHDLEAWSLTPR